jgi:hypothetical protein
MACYATRSDVENENNFEMTSWPFLWFPSLFFGGRGVLLLSFYNGKYTNNENFFLQNRTAVFFPKALLPGFELGSSDPRQVQCDLVVRFWMKLNIWNDSTCATQADDICPKNRVYRNALHCLKMSVQKEGYAMLLRGIGSTIVRLRVARFVLAQTYQNWEKYTKWPQTIPNCHKLYQMAIKYF